MITHNPLVAPGRDGPYEGGGRGPRARDLGTDGKGGSRVSEPARAACGHRSAGEPTSRRPVSGRVSRPPVPPVERLDRRVTGASEPVSRSRAANRRGRGEAIETRRSAGRLVGHRGTQGGTRREESGGGYRPLDLQGR